MLLGAVVILIENAMREIFHDIENAVTVDYGDSYTVIRRVEHVDAVRGGLVESFMRALGGNVIHNVFAGGVQTNGAAGKSFQKGRLSRELVGKTTLLGHNLGMIARSLCEPGVPDKGFQAGVAALVVDEIEKKRLWILTGSEGNGRHYQHLAPRRSIGQHWLGVCR
jgi:hypothetical protein